MGHDGSHDHDLLPPEFFARDALHVARDLLGKHIRRGEVLLRITEVEAYRSPDDTANHCRAGRTARNAPMWGPPGHAYVYICYGIHAMLNLVTGREGDGEAVLIRSCEPVGGLDLVRSRRGGKDGPALLDGPGKVGAALALDTSWSHHPLFEAGGLEVLAGPPPEGVLAGPRVGIAYADPEHVAAPWRLAAAGTRWVSQRKHLAPAD
ncbi:MAG: DNA-3-methyladenine glycosylase [Myxococcota bacterium]